MKAKMIRYCTRLFLLVPLFWMTSCTDKEDYYNHSTTISAFDFISENGTVDITGSASVYYNLEWTRSKAEDYTAVFYEVLFFGREGSSDTPDYSIIPNKLGSENFITLSDSLLNIIAEACDIEPLSNGEINWTVRASNGIAQMMPSSVKRTLNVKRTKDGLAIIPSALFIAGTATSAGDNLNKSGKGSLVDRAKGIFEFVLPLNAGTFYFTDSQGSKHRVFGIEDSKIKRDFINESPTNFEKIYRLKLNCSDLSVEFKEVVSVDQIVAKTGSTSVSVIANLNHTENCTWQSTFVASTSLPTGCPYKFRFTESDVYSGVSGYSYWGSTNIAGSTPPTSTTPASYFHVVSSASEEGNFYRFPTTVLDKPNGKTLTTVLVMSPGIESYYHSSKIQES